MGQDYKGIEITTFRYPITQGGTQKASFVVRLMSGVPDRRFAIKTKDNGGNDVYDHQFIYVPVKPVSSPPYSNASASNYIYLNNNLGAEYTRYGSSVFDPGQQAKDHDDYNAFGSLWQFGRPADGHELVTYTSATNWDFKYGTTATPTTTYPPQPTENKTVIPTVTAESNGVDTTPMWYAGTTIPTNYPITFSNDNNNVCPYGFRIADSYELNIINQFKSFDKMKDFFIRLPSNPKNVTNAGDNGTYTYGPKLWVSKRTAYQNQQIQSGLVVRSHIAVAMATDYYWEPASQTWREYDGNGNLLAVTNYESFPSSKPYPKSLRKYYTSSSWPSVTSINGTVYSAAYGGGDVGSVRSITDSYAIRCVKGS